VSPVTIGLYIGQSTHAMSQRFADVAAMELQYADSMVGSDEYCPLFKLKGPTVLHVQIVHGFQNVMTFRITHGL
jgi:hypothetical protein